MKATLAFGYIFAFVITVVAGYWLGGHYAPEISAAQARTGSPQSETVLIGQFNLLLTQVQHLETRRPGLQVIWLVAIKPETPIQFIPIFPSAPQNPTRDSELSQIFGLRKHGFGFELDGNLIKYLQERGLVWDGSIIVDSRALADFIATFGQIKVDGESLDSHQLAENKFPVFDTAQQSLTFQTLLWREVCWNVLHSPANIPDLSLDFKKHASWIFSNEINHQDWMALLSSVEVPSCEFPMFQQVNP
jgi:hypothetical protein